MKIFLTNLIHVKSEQNLEVNDILVVDNDCSSTISNDVNLDIVNREVQESVVSVHKM